IPVAESNPEALASLAADSREPSVARSIARRLGEEIDSEPAAINVLLASSASRPVELRASIVGGLIDALAGVRRAKKPAAWETFQSGLDQSILRELTSKIRELNVLFGDGRALDEVKRLALDEKADLETRKAAVRTLIENRPS